jgi:hypothetical protein
MPHQEGDEESQVHHYEKRQTGNSGRLSGVRDKAVQNRQVLALVRRYNLPRDKKLDISVYCPAFYRFKG